MRAMLASLLTLVLAVPVFAQNQDIAETAKAAGQFETLCKAVEAAGLGETLKSEGPYTVLAPTDEAFEKLPEGTLEELLKPENKEKLAGILKLHIIKGKVSSSQVQQLGGKSVPTLCPEGSQLRVMSTGGQVKFQAGGSTATVIKPDVMASNGVIHAIDTVLLPSKE